MKHYIIIVAGGSGSRMKAETPKQFLLLDGKPILMHTIARFHEADAQMQLIVVLPQKEMEEWKTLCAKHNFNIPHQLAAGGETRFHSVKNGLEFVKEESIVAIHDGVRPFASVALIKKCFVEAEQKGNAVPCIRINESIRKVEEEGSKIADRNSFVIIQTPQYFNSEILKKAYQSEFKNIFTDDASVTESSGEKINLIEGERENIKITFPVDLMLAETILKNRQA